VTDGVELGRGLAGVAGVDLGVDDSLRGFERAGQNISVAPADRGVAPGQPIVVTAVDPAPGRSRGTSDPRMQ
jgi:hypothetical protein